MKETYITLADINSALPKATAEKFKIVNMNKRTSLKVFSAKFGNIDFRTLTVARAEQLLKSGANFIEAVKSKESTKS